MLAHVAFSVSYAVVVVRARLVGFDRSLEEAAMDLGARPWRTFLQVTLPGIAPGVLAAALLVFALSHRRLRDHVLRGRGGLDHPARPDLLHGAHRHLARDQRGLDPPPRGHERSSSSPPTAWSRASRLRSAAIPAALGLLILSAPFVLVGPRALADRVLNLYIWSNYIAPETVKKFEERHHVRVNVDLYDTNEAMLAKVQAGNVAYDVLCPSNYAIEILLKQGLLAPPRPLGPARTS